MDSLKEFILAHPFLKNTALAINAVRKEIQLWQHTRAELNKCQKTERRIFYIGIPAHANLGDLAQGVCIRRWLRKNYPDRTIVEIETNAIVNTRFSLIGKLKKMCRADDFIVFQSGYTTTDLGGFADEMHRAIMKALPDVRMLMLPQTIFFKHKKNEKRTSDCYNRMQHLLFLARDRVSYDMACRMFPDISVKLYPDIVTTLIGSVNFASERMGILFCCRDDGEKFYSDEQIVALMNRCRKIAKVTRTDTTKHGRTKDIVRNAEKLIFDEVKEYSKYKVIITDRYHGTILSLVAGTPVIIIKTTDHKVTTGAEWFQGVYDDYVYLAEDLEQAYVMVETVYHKNLTHKLKPYFEEKYYDKLPEIFQKIR